MKMAIHFPLLVRALIRLSILSNKAAYRLLGDRHAGMTGALLDDYVPEAPAHQNAVDSLPGWTHALPPNFKIKAGAAASYSDPRIHWALKQYGDIKDRRILELGPLEASHTYMIDQLAPRSIDSIEANKTAYLRCLVVKEILGLKNAHFFLGNFVPWLEEDNREYDLIIGSGVLYHMQDPIKLLCLIAQRCDAFYLWTHYFDENLMPIGDPRRKPFVGDVKIEDRLGLKVRLHARSYFSAWQSKAFCGGPYDLHYWLERDDIIAVIKAMGFNDIQISHEEPQHQNGPSFSVFARRSATPSA
jgi:hypothetical protein